MRFWDTSALVPLVVEQTGSSDAEGWLAEDAQVVTWTLTFVEMVSALRRLVREGSLEEHAAVQAEALALEILRRTHVVTDVEGVKQVAARLLRVHAIRAADSLQLAAALTWAEGAPSSQVVYTLDRRLGLAAQREGFIVVPDPSSGS